MDTYFLTDKGLRYVQTQGGGFPPDRSSPQMQLAKWAILATFIGTESMSTDYDDIVDTSIGTYKGGVRVTEQDVRSSLRQLYEAGLVYRIEQ